MQKKSPAKQYTYTVSESRKSKKQQKKVPKEKVLITKSKLKKGAKGLDHLGGVYPTSAYDVKKKEVTQKRANRKTSRKSGWVQPIAGSKSIAQQKFPEIKEENQGKFTAWAKKNGFKDACSAASAVMKSKKKYSSNVVKMANYANNFGCSTAKSPAKQKRPKPETTTEMGRTSKGRYETTTKTFYKKPKTYDHKSDPNKIYQAAEPRKIVVKQKTKAIDKNKSLHSQKGKIKNADKKTRTVKRFKK